MLCGFAPSLSPLCRPVIPRSTCGALIIRSAVHGRVGVLMVHSEWPCKHSWRLAHWHCENSPWLSMRTYENILMVQSRTFLFELQLGNHCARPCPVYLKPFLAYPSCRCKAGVWFQLKHSDIYWNHFHRPPSVAACPNQFHHPRLDCQGAALGLWWCFETGGPRPQLFASSLWF